jgi:uncharacterized membrane protein (DUF4010 family)
VSFFGAILGYLTNSFNSLWVIIGFITIILFALSSYVITYMKSKKLSATTQISFILTYVLGVMCTTENSGLAVIFAILIATFLISTSFLAQLNVFNFYNIWLMVIFIGGINLLGYFLVKIIGSKRGYGLIGLVGGLVSSTAVTLSMADESKRAKSPFSPFLLATIIATAVMFIRVIFEVAVINARLLPVLIFPMGAMAITGFILAFIFYKRKSKKKAKEVELTQPFAIGPALKFGGLFAIILVVSRAAQVLFGKVGIYVTSFLSGLADVDAITLTMSSLSRDGGVSSIVATTAIILAVASNTLVKVGIAYFLGNKKFGKYILWAFLGILAVGGLVLFL